MVRKISFLQWWKEKAQKTGEYLYHQANVVKFFFFFFHLRLFPSCSFLFYHQMCQRERVSCRNFTSGYMTATPLRRTISPSEPAVWLTSRHNLQWFHSEQLFFPFCFSFFFFFFTLFRFIHFAEAYLQLEFFDLSFIFIIQYKTRNKCVRKKRKSYGHSIWIDDTLCSKENCYLDYFFFL